jgi:hypothetical protein
MGEKPGVDTPVSFAEQDRIAGRNAGYDMDQALAVERLQQQGAMARHRESGDHITAAERNKAAEVARCIARNGPGSEDRCWAQADKHLKSEMTPAGQVITWNPVSQTVSTPERPEFQVPDIGGRSQFEGANMRPMPGAVGLARAGLNNALGTVGLPEWGPEINEWFTGIRRFRDQNAVALAQALEGRPSVYLVQMYRDLTVDPDAWIQGPEGVKRQLVDFNRNVAQNLSNLEDEYRIFGNSWDSETLRKANAELVALRDMQADANYMLAQFDRPGGQQAPGQQGEVSIPPVVPPEKHDLFLNMTPEQQAEYVGLLESLQGGQ